MRFVANTAFVAWLMQDKPAQARIIDPRERRSVAADIHGKIQHKPLEFQAVGEIDRQFDPDPLVSGQSLHLCQMLRPKLFEL